ncbi:MAG: hypothetical protein U5K33_10740 [Halofilum sp. (in: g-proteobacteria)]|nr:hypothetical protein [Halofilum sp. (in: g-proteobacteria)]
MLALDPRRRLRQPAQRLVHRGQVLAAGVGQPQSLRIAVEQRRAQVGLEPADLVADRRRRAVQLGRGMLETEQLRGSLEGAQGLHGR